MKLAKYKPQSELVLLAYKGSTFQGGFGHDKHPFDRVEDLFNLYHFVEAKGTLWQIIVREKKQRENYERLIESYDLRVRFKHEEAYENIELVKDTRISLNRGFLGRLNNDVYRMQLVLVDLISNARRRLEEKGFDDAVAVLYRAIELIPQIKLRDYELDDLSEAKFTIADLKQRGVDTRVYELYADEKGKLKLGLEKKFILLRDLGWNDADDMYLKNNMLRSLLQNRNNSIRAHGLEPVEKETANELFDEVKKHAKIVLPELDELMEEASFPKL